MKKTQSWSYSVRRLLLLTPHPSLKLRPIKRSFRACSSSCQLIKDLSCQISPKLHSLSPFSRFQVPYPGKRQHHTCPCLPHLVCTRYADSKYRCTEDFKNMDF
uniref:Prokineticin 1 n=1 Tax=Haplochromis burtoni TaxID=8153 RepID=A0A3Q2WEI7_HAPBU